jgi:hypothetical protein
MPKKKGVQSIVLNPLLPFSLHVQKITNYNICSRRSKTLATAMKVAAMSDLKSTISFFISSTLIQVFVE